MHGQHCKKSVLGKLFFCGGVNIKPLSPLTFPQCVSCGSKDPVKRTKRKQVHSEDLSNGKKKK